MAKSRPSQALGFFIALAFNRCAKTCRIDLPYRACQPVVPTMPTLQKLVLIFCLSIAANAWSGGSAEDIQHLRALLQPIGSLSARFEQRIVDADGFELQNSTGVFQVSQPNRLRWQIESPMPQQIIADGVTLWVYDPDLEQVIIQPFNQDIAATPAILFSGDLEQLDRAYFVRQLSENSFELQPEQGGSLFSRMIITFDGSAPSSLTLIDNLEQTTTIGFSQLELNPVLPDGQFVFEIPDGVDVINNGN